MDQFLVLLAGGVHVRRHQNRKYCEIVRLFSTNGGKLIQWEQPDAAALVSQRRRKSEESNPFPLPLKKARLSATHDHSEFESDLFDCFVASKNDSIFLQNLRSSLIISYLAQSAAVSMIRSL